MATRPSLSYCAKWCNRTRPRHRSAGCRVCRTFENGEGFYRKFNFITEGKLLWHSVLWQTAIKKVKKRGQIECRMAVMCEDDLILAEGHCLARPTSWGGKKRNPSTIFCALQFRWTESPCPHRSWHLFKIMWWGVQSCLQAAMHQKWLWQVWGFYFLFCSALLETHFRHSMIGYTLCWEHVLIPHNCMSVCNVAADTKQASHSSSRSISHWIQQIRNSFIDCRRGRSGVATAQNRK